MGPVVDFRPSQTLSNFCSILQDFSFSEFPSDALRLLLPLAFAEDEGIGAEKGDITSIATIPEGTRSRAHFIAKEPGVAAGLEAVEIIFAFRGFPAQFKKGPLPGTEFQAGTNLLTVEAETRHLLVCERIALNFVQRLCGIATSARRYSQVLAGSSTRLLDTRKTLPGYRALDKYAVRLGGGTNHRTGLYDQVLIKDNHIRACGSVREAVERVRARFGDKYQVEAEVTSLEELETLLDARVDIVLLDNMSDAEMARAVKRVKEAAPAIKLEASGGVTLDRLAAIAKTGVDFVSVGALTHSVRALDISLQFEEGEC